MKKKHDKILLFQDKVSQDIGYEYIFCNKNWAKIMDKKD